MGILHEMVVLKVSLLLFFSTFIEYAVEWNLASRTPLFANNLVHEQIFRAKTSRMTNGVSDYEHVSWKQRHAETIGAGVSVAG
jgi:hypothetical protein